MFFKDKEHEVRKVQREKRKTVVEDMLRYVIATIEDMGGEFRLNEPGSGDITYILNNHTIDFNQWLHEFTGFKIDGKSVTFKEVMNLITRLE